MTEEQQDQQTDEQPQSTGDPVLDALNDIRREQAAHREEVASLRAQLNAAKTPAPVASATAQTPEELLQARMDEVNQHDYYCPGCGKLYDYRRECTGSGVAPHPPIDVVSTDELKAGDPSKHTPAPAIVA